MTTIDQFTDAQRRLIVAEIARHRKAAFDEGYRLGIGEGRTLTVADWVRGIIKSWTMWVGTAGVAMGLSAEVWPVAADVLKDYVDPRTLAVVSAVFMALRAKTDRALPAK